jgi:hypothetical protein
MKKALQLLCLFSVIQLNAMNLEIGIYKQTPLRTKSLHVAIANNWKEELNSLVNNSTTSDFNTKNREGNTPLHLAVLNEQLEAVYKLSFVGANPFIKNNNNHTALELAQAKLAQLAKERDGLRTPKAIKIAIIASRIKRHIELSKETYLHS